MQVSFLATSLLLSASFVSGAANFYPEYEGIYANGLDVLPIPYNLTETQRKSDTFAAGSFWTSSFVRGSNNHDYLIVSHVMSGVPFWSAGTSMYRDGVLNATFDDYGFVSVGDDALRTWSTVAGAEFDLSIELSSPALLNGGIGAFEIDSTLYQWSLPAGKTTGCILVDGSNVTVNARKSLTWYDRQFNGGPPDWTWFQLHLDTRKAGAAVVAVSVWVWNDSDTGFKGIASIREEPGIQKVVPVKSLEPSERTYTSQASGAVYSLDWVLTLVDGSKLQISSVRDDQELHAEGGVFPAYTGYITAEGNFGTAVLWKWFHLTLQTELTSSYFAVRTTKGELILS
ncbi:hypothetical protein EDB81DRAFT_889084 [Dactylonectria macrodidyma]|uniref:Kievitone hydratase n=1 Tax=Dactylonectria macrodidyma TaxID=307937 RepID=A0A9P9IQ95_9HYPO|nr:hypothetical protein EDB81DRAFT_889084 [Dactylonectria macrodidyma]